MKKSKIILIIIDIIAICGVIYIYYTWQNKQKLNDNNPDIEEKNNNNEDIIYNDVTFKKFIYSLPSNIKYSELNEYEFKLENDEFDATIEILIHDDTNMLNYPELYYDVLKEDGIKVSEPIKEKKGLIDIVKYNKTNDDGKNTVLYYFKYDDNFDYELELYDTGDNLGNIMNILLSAKYDNESKEKYNYHVWDFAEELENNKN